MFSTDIKISFRQKLVVLVGFQICLVLIANVFCANEYAEQLEYENQMEEMVEHYEGIERVRAKLEGEDLHRCCSARVEEKLPTVDDNPRIVPTEMSFMEPLDITRANMDRKYKDGKYLLFIDEKKNVYYFNIYLPPHDMKFQQERMKDWLEAGS